MLEADLSRGLQRPDIMHADNDDVNEEDAPRKKAGSATGGADTDRLTLLGVKWAREVRNGKTCLSLVARACVG